MFKLAAAIGLHILLSTTVISHL